MEHPTARRWCPRCRELTLNAPLPLLAEETQRLREVAQQVQGLAHRYYCQECRAIWQAVEVPAELLQQLLAAQEENHQLRHQLAMLRLLAAQQEQAHPADKAA